MPGVVLVILLLNAATPTTDAVYRNKPMSTVQCARVSLLRPHAVRGVPRNVRSTGITCKITPPSRRTGSIANTKRIVRVITAIW